MLHDLVNDDRCVALRREAKDREGWRHKEKVWKTLFTAAE